MSLRNNKPINCELPSGLAADLRQDALRSGQRPAEFWDAQRLGVRARIASAGSEGAMARRPQSFLISAVAVVAIFLAVLFITPARPLPQKVPTRATIDADQELLLAVEHSLATGTPAALEPLTLLVESSVNHNQPQSISHKEQGNEN